VLIVVLIGLLSAGVVLATLRRRRRRAQADFDLGAPQSGADEPGDLFGPALVS